MLGSSKPISPAGLQKLAEIDRISDYLKRHSNALTSFAWQTGLSYLSAALTQFMISQWVKNTTAGSSIFHAFKQIQASNEALMRDLKKIASSDPSLGAQIMALQEPLYGEKKLNLARQLFLDVGRVLNEITLGLCPANVFESWMPPGNLNCISQPPIDCNDVLKKIHCSQELEAIDHALHKIPIAQLLAQNALHRTQQACPHIKVTEAMLGSQTQLAAEITEVQGFFPSVGTSTFATRSLRRLMQYAQPQNHTTSDATSALRAISTHTTALPEVGGLYFGHPDFADAMKSFRGLIEDFLNNQDNNMHKSRMMCFAEVACISIYIGVAIMVLIPILKTFDIASGAIYGLIGLFCQLVVMPVFAMAITAIAPKIITPKDNIPKIESANPTSEEIDKVHEELKRLESASYPWENYINYLLALLLPLLIILFIISFRDKDNQYPSPGSILTAVGPVLGSIVRAVTGQTHRAFIRLYGIPFYTDLTQKWLKKALLLNAPDPLASIFELTEAKIETSKASSWEQVQFVLVKKNSIAITRNEVEEKLLAVSELLSAYKINYYLVARVKEYALYINAASAYQALRSSLGNEGIAVAQLANGLKIALTGVELVQQVNGMLEKLKQQNIIHQYWFDDNEHKSISYDLLVDAEKYGSVQTAFSPYINKENRLSLPINQSVISKLISAAIKNLLSITHLSTNSSTHIPQPASQLKQKKSLVKKEAPVNQTEPEVPTAPKTTTHTWIFDKKTYSYPEDRDILMVWGMPSNQKPCFIVNELTPKMFSSDFAYKRIFDLLGNPKLATSAKSQQGLVFFTDKQGNKRIKAKPYGRVMGVGDLRPYSDPVLKSARGAELYIISYLGDHRTIELL